MSRGLDSVALDDFVDRAEEVSRQIEALLHDKGPVKPANAAEEAEQAAERVRRRRWERELAATARREERDKWWTKARLFYNAETNDSGEGGAAASSSSSTATPPRRYTGPEAYSKWDRWVPDDPVTKEEEERLRIAQEKAADEAFEKANPGFVAAFMADLEARKAGDKKKERLAALHKDRGNAAYKAGDMDGAIKEYCAAIEQAPFTVAALNNLAQAHLRRATETGSKTGASASSSSTDDTVERYASLLFDWECALDYADRVVFIAPGEVKALFRRALARTGAWGAVRTPPPTLTGPTALQAFPALQPATKSWIETLLAMPAVIACRLSVRDLEAAAALPGAGPEVARELAKARVDLAEAAAADPTTAAATAGSSSSAATSSSTAAASASSAAPAAAAAAPALPQPLTPLAAAFAAADAAVAGTSPAASLPALLPRLLPLDADTALRPAAAALVASSSPLPTRLALSVAFRTSGLLGRLAASVAWTLAYVQALGAGQGQGAGAYASAAAAVGGSGAGTGKPGAFVFLLHPAALEPALLLLSAGACDNARAMRELASGGALAAVAGLVGTPLKALRPAVEALFQVPTTAVPVTATEVGAGTASSSSSSSAPLASLRFAALAPLLSAALGLLDLFSSPRHAKAASSTTSSGGGGGGAASKATASSSAEAEAGAYVAAPAALATEAAAAREGVLARHPTLLASPPLTLPSGGSSTGGGLLGLLAVSLRAGVDNLFRAGGNNKKGTASVADPDGVETENLDGLLSVVKGAADVVAGLAAAAAAGDAALARRLAEAVVSTPPPPGAPSHPPTPLVHLALSGLTSLVVTARLYDRPALLTSATAYSLVAAVSGLAEVAELRPAFTTLPPGAASGAALPCMPLLLLQATPIGATSAASSPSSGAPFAGSGDDAWEAIRGTALAALANACLGSEAAVEALAGTREAVPMLASLVLASAGVAVPPALSAAAGPAAAPSPSSSQPLARLLAAASGPSRPQPASLPVAGRAAVALGRLLVTPEEVAPIAEPAVVTGLVDTLVAAAAAATSPDAATAAHAATLEDGVVRVLAAAFATRGNAGACATYGPFFTAGPALGVLSGILRRAIATMGPSSTAAGVASGVRSRVPCVGNVCKLVIALAEEEGGRRAMLRAGLVDAAVEALKAGASRETGPAAAAAAVVKNNAAVALAKLCRDAACMARIRDLRGLDILTQLGSSLLKG